MIEVIELYEFKQDVVASLLTEGEGVQVSLYMPVQQETDKRSENRIRLKNLAGAVETKLLDAGWRRPDVDQLLAPAEELITGGRFLDVDMPGLAVYLSQKSGTAYKLPLAPEESATVASEFIITPLLPLHTGNVCYVLALSQENVRLLRVSRSDVERVNLEGMPDSLSEALRWDDPEKQLQWHSQTGKRADGRAAMFHGHGVATKEAQKEDLLRYFQLLDKWIGAELSGKKVPLVLAGVDYLLPIYRQASNYQYLVEDKISGNQETLSDEALGREAWQLAVSEFNNERDAAIARYDNALSQQKATSNPESILKAAHQGRVDTLFVSPSDRLWGVFNPDSGQVTINKEQTSVEASELLNLATIFTLQSSGAIIAAKREKLPEQKPLAAILRY